MLRLCLFRMDRTGPSLFFLGSMQYKNSLENVNVKTSKTRGALSSYRGMIALNVSALYILDFFQIFIIRNYINRKCEP